ncbi:MAG: BMP family ABC transporter substrate-binding protein, partial [Actinomycetota bacterium]
MKRYARVIGLVAVLALVLAACGGDGTADTTEAPAETTATTTPETTEAPPETTATTEAPTETTETTMGEEPMGDAITACEVTDTGGIDDASFNETAWRGVENAIEDGLATEDSDFIESQAPADYEPNINSFIEAGCDLVITVGFLLTEATAAAAEANPDQNFLLLDSTPEE